MTIEQRTVRLMQLLYPGNAFTFICNLTSLLGEASFPCGTQSVLIASLLQGWHVFWYRGRALILSEQELGTISVGKAARRVAALEHVGLLRLYPDQQQTDYFALIHDFPYREGEFVQCIDMSEHVIDIQLTAEQMSEKQARWLSACHMESELFGATGPW